MTTLLRATALLAGVLVHTSLRAQPATPDPTLAPAQVTASSSNADSFAARSNATWETMASMATARAQHGAVAHPNGNIYVFGGYTGSTTLSSAESYNIATNTWSAQAAMPVAIQGMATALGQDGNIYSFAGRDLYTYRNECYRYNPTTNTWSGIAPMPTPLWQARALTAANGTIYVFGGWNYDISVMPGTNVQIYNPATNTWTQGAPIPVALMGMGAATDRDGQMHLYGGIGADPYPTQTAHYIYSPANNTWTTGPNMPAPARGYAASTAGADGNLYIIGGDSDIPMNLGTFYNHVHYYTPTTSTWSAGTALPLALTELQTVAAGNFLYTLGGLSATNTPAATLYRANVVDLPLPVELVSFTAEPDGPAAHLRWATASEKNSAYFAVEVSTNGREFREAGRRPAQGHSSRRHFYHFTDHNLSRHGSPLLYYRLHQVDQDGTFSYSPVRTVQFGSTATVAIFPNPTTGNATLTGAAPGQPVQVLDALGRQVATAPTDAAGRAVLELPPGTPGGLYVVRSGASYRYLRVVLAN